MTKVFDGWGDKLQKQRRKQLRGIGIFLKMSSPYRCLQHLLLERRLTTPVGFEGRKLFLSIALVRQHMLAIVLHREMSYSQQYTEPRSDTFLGTNPKARNTDRLAVSQMDSTKLDAQTRFCLRLRAVNYFPAIGVPKTPIDGSLSNSSTFRFFTPHVPSDST